MTIDQIRTGGLRTHAGSDTATQPDANTRTVARPAVEPAAAPPSGAVAGKEERDSRRGLTSLVVGVLGLLALVGGLALAFTPYDRGLVGYLEGSRTIVESECAAPVSSAFGSGDRTLVDGSTWTDGPPCRRSATFRLVLGGLLAVTGVAALGGAARAGGKPARR